jgi:hypothetical protein
MAPAAVASPVRPLAQSKPDVVPPPLPPAPGSKPEVAPIALTPAVPRTEEVRTPPTPPAVLEAALAADTVKVAAIAESRPRLAEPSTQPRVALEPREDTRALIRAAIEEAVGPLYRAITGLESRIAELERRPAPTIVQQIVQPAAASPAAAVAAARPVLHSQPQAFVPAQAAAPAAVMAPRNPAFDPGAVDLHIEMDGAIDGGKRKRRTVWTLILFIVVVFGGLGFALLSSYQHH